MKNLNKLLLLLTICAFSFTSLQAQNIDREEMRQDIDILEGVLEEMFEIQKKAGRYFVTDISEIDGTFLPEYGVIFHIQKPSYSNSDSERRDFQKFVTDKIMQFLTNYASTLDQLEDNQKVQVIFEKKETEGVQILYSPRNKVDKNEPAFASISVAVKGSLVKAYQMGKISNKEFRERATIIVKEKDEKKSTDLKIMADILETVFNEGEEKQFQINGDVNYLKLNGFGALFSFEITYGDRFGIFRLSEANIKETFRLKSFSVTKRDSSSSISISLDSLNVKLDELSEFYENVATPIVTHFDNESKSILSGDTLKPDVINGIDIYSNSRNEQQLAENAKKALQQFLTQLKETIIDYGPTLDSISSNDQLLFSVEVGSSYDELLERVALQVEKSVLEAAVRSEISEDEAIEEISVRKIQ